MNDSSYYHCQHCREEVCLEIICPCCSLGNPTPSPSEELLKWLKVHMIGFKMRIDAMDWEYDRGYVKACEVIQAEMKRLIEEHQDGSDRVAGNKGLLDGKVPACDDNAVPET